MAVFDLLLILISLCNSKEDNFLSCERESKTNKNKLPNKFSIFSPNQQHSFVNHDDFIYHCYLDEIIKAI